MKEINNNNMHNELNWLIKNLERLIKNPNDILESVVTLQKIKYKILSILESEDQFQSKEIFEGCFRIIDKYSERAIRAIPRTILMELSNYLRNKGIKLIKMHRASTDGGEYHETMSLNQIQGLIDDLTMIMTVSKTEDISIEDINNSIRKLYN
jgi:hypothetical protein